MKYSELSPEQRAAIDAGAEDVKNDTNPPAPESKADAVVAKFVAEGGQELQDSNAAEQDALAKKREVAAEEYEGIIKAKLEIAYAEAVNAVMFNADLHTGTTEGKKEFDKLMANKDAIINATMAKMGFERIPEDQAQKTMLEIMSKEVTISDESSA